MVETLDIEAIRENLRRIMARKKAKPTTLSLQVGKSKTLVKDLLEKTDDVRLSTLVKLAGALNVGLETLLAQPRVPVAGRIGAGGCIVFEDVGEELDPDNSVLRPPGVSGQLVALMVYGESMLPKYRHGDIIYIQRNHNGLLPDYLGEDCAIRLTSGETYLKQLSPGSSPGLFTLRSLNAADITDVEIEWATPVLFIMPQRSRLAVEE